MDEGKRPKRVRRSFTDEFKAGAVRLVLDEGKTVAQVARDLDLTASGLGDWVKQARADRSKGKTGLTTEERAEPAQLRKENRQLKMERDLLEKWAACLAMRRDSFDDTELATLSARGWQILTLHGPGAFLRPDRI